MKKHLLLCFASLAASVMFAQALPKRVTGLPMKQICHAERFVRPSFAAPQLAPRSAEAPATFYEVPFVHSLGKGETDIIAGYVAFDSNATVTVTAPSGCTLFSNTVAADARISLPAGIYIVKLHGTATKVLVR